LIRLLLLLLPLLLGSDAAQRPLSLGATVAPLAVLQLNNTAAAAAVAGGQ
jgi:hypothetical protein